MLVMFQSDGTLILAITDPDVDRLVAGETVEYVNPPHDPQLVRDIVLLHGVDKADVIAQIKACGLDVPEVVFEGYLKDERTDRPRKAH